jgi:hypothetical protein
MSSLSPLFVREEPLAGSSAATLWAHAVREAVRGSNRPDGIALDLPFLKAAGAGASKAGQNSRVFDPSMRSVLRPRPGPTDDCVFDMPPRARL